MARLDYFVVLIALLIKIHCISCGNTAGEHIAVCEQPLDVGTSPPYYSGNRPSPRGKRWYYDKTTQKCKQFLYKGSGGNDNRFASKSQCEKACPPIVLDVCRLPKDRGECYANLKKYFYNSATKQCEVFFYGGCGGNGNRFDTLILCQERCMDVCKLPKDPGTCSESVRKFYHDKNDKECKEFIYTGCGGNANQFDRREVCDDKCIHPCWQKKKPGPCLAYFERYFYNKMTKKCETFGWGGCNANSNNFKTKAECEDMCLNICEQPRKPGPCYAAIRRYYYDSDLEQCKMFIYGGCEANGNNFLTEEDCEQACEDPCMQPKKVGPCEAAIVRYYYNKHTMRCEKFIWGGCQPNSNNFESKLDCQKKCVVKNICGQDKDSGPCYAKLTRYYYDSYQKQCKTFVYGGCKGNKNNFLSKKECERACKDGY